MTVAMTTGDWGVPESKRAIKRRAAFRKAQRHTTLVRFLRRAIPIGAVLAVVGLVSAPFLRPLSGVAGVSISSVGISGGKVKMEAPRLSGYRKDNRPYEVTAEAALQDIRNPTEIELSAMTAKIQLEREGWVTVNARTGLFNSQREKLKLVDDVKVVTETGYDMRMRTADIDFKAGSVVSREPVKALLGQTTVEGNSLDVKDNGALIVFDGRVRVVIENAPARALAGPEREGSTPAPELLRSDKAPANPPEEPGAAGRGSPTGTRQ